MNGLEDFAQAHIVLHRKSDFGENLAGTDMGKAVWLCVGALVGGMFQLLIPLWGLRREGWRPGSTHVDEKAWKTLSIAFLPAALGAGVQQINVLVSRALAIKESDAGLMYYYVANRIVELPIGLFSASIAVVIFPALATAFAEKDLVMLEVGPGQALAPFARQHPELVAPPKACSQTARPVL